MKQSFFLKNLIKWHFENNNRDLPWKGEKDPYKIWLSEIMLQQTRVEQGIGYYHKFLAHFPDITSLANADETLIFKLWEGLGYYRRCRNLIETAKYIETHYHGKFPTTYNEILALPGIGPYTAAAISSFAFGLPYAVVDGNVKRVLARFYNIELPVDSGEGKKKIQELADKNLDKDSPGVYNQAMMDLGATICTPANPDCVHCPLKKECKALKNNVVHLLPVKAAKAKSKTRYFNYFVIKNKDSVLVRKRAGEDIWKELYEFPLIESDHLFNKKEIANIRELKPHLDKKLYTIEKISNSLSQQLTHQKIIAQLIILRSSGRIYGFRNAKNTKKKIISLLPFPKILSAYVKMETNV